MLPVIITILFSAVKFAMTFPLAVVEFQFSFLETLLWTNIGGILGIYFFAYLSGRLISWWNQIFGKPRSENPGYKSGGRKLFTRRNRRIVRIKQRYGLLGIAATTPFLLSIPVGTFLVVRYYRHTRTRFLYLIASNVVWSVIYTGFYMFWDGLLLHRP